MMLAGIAGLKLLNRYSGCLVIQRASKYWICYNCPCNDLFVSWRDLQGIFCNEEGFQTAAYYIRRNETK